MVFVDKEHENFFYEKKRTAKNIDVYNLPVFYLLGLTEETRNHFDQLFNIWKNEIYTEQLLKGWQTGTTYKITRLAFNLFNGNVYDTEEDYKNDNVSPKYATDEIFCCSFAPYFWEAIKLRYPEYCIKF